ncbi:MAG: DUF2130 domain-containing protein [Ignavibacteria bacterium]|nr:DUF2130 domain-containing protein [Ignavibacteria bacterium]
MSTQRQITCPNCGQKIDIEELLAHDVEERVRSEFAEKARAERTQLVADAKKEERSNYEEKVKLLEAQSADSKKELQRIRGIELDHMKLKVELEKKNEEFALELERRSLEVRVKAEEQVRKTEQERNELGMRELQKKLTDQAKLIEELQKKAQQGSQQLQGETQELALEEFLQSTFPMDVIEPIVKGARGGDCIHHVQKNGVVVGMIYYESKRTKTFGADWVEKLKSDMRAVGADAGVIVTETMPKEMERFGSKDGIWICSFQEFKGLCLVLREMVLTVSLALVTQENKGEKMVMLYDYLMGPEFRNNIEGVMDSFHQMQSDVSRERAAMEKMWKQRDKQIEKVILSMSSVIGSLTGIAGKDLAEFKSLQLPASE